MSAATHHALYALILLIPVFGVVAYVWHGRVFDYGVFRFNFGVQMNREVFKPAETMHQFLAYGCLHSLDCTPLPRCITILCGATGSS
jgi:cytochrome b561